MGIETALLGASLAIGAGSMLLSKREKPADPPPAVTPAAPAPTAREGGAVVRVGDTDASDDDGNLPDYKRFQERRSSGRTLGGLGRSGLGL